MDPNPLAEELLEESRPTVAERNAQYRTGGSKFDLRDHDDLESIPLAPKFHGTKEPQVSVMTEKPIHRLMAFWVASGKSNTELAERTGYSLTHISTLTRQPWFQQQVSHIIAEAGENEVMARIRGAGVDSVMKLIELRDSANSPSVQLGASKELLDRLLGKPQQNISHIEKKQDPVDELQAVERELAGLKAQDKQLNE